MFFQQNSYITYYIFLKHQMVSVRIEVFSIMFEISSTNLESCTIGTLKRNDPTDNFLLLAGSL